MIQFILSLIVFFAAFGASTQAHGSIPKVVNEALTQSLGVSGARLIPITFSKPKHCQIQHASVAQPIVGSGRIPVKFSGQGCAGFAWAEVQVWVDMAITVRPIAKGQPLAGAIRRTEREVRRGQPLYWPSEEAVASRPIPAGTVVSKRDVAGGNEHSAGSGVQVVVMTGALAVTVQGRRIPCGSGRLCAVLPSGKRVEGTMDAADRLIVELP